MTKLNVYSSRDKIPKGMSFPVKFNQLETALKTAKIEIEVSVNFRNSKREFDVFFWPPNANVPYERLYVVVGVVPSARAQVARALVSETILPDMINWLHEILSLPIESPRRRVQQVFMRTVAR